MPKVQYREGDVRSGLAAALQRKTVDLLIEPEAKIPPEMTFRQWCEALSQERADPATGEPRPSLRVDGRPFTLDDRPAMAWVYDQVPSTPQDAFRSMLVLRKCTQVGFTTMEMLATIYFLLKFNALKVGSFVPTCGLARTKSQERFMPMLRTVPEAYEMLPKGREGNVTVRRIGDGLIHFLWTSGKVATESNPMDVLCFDEVQEMLIADMEKAVERLSASSFKFTLMGSTANWPDADIDYWYKKGSRHRFHTRCPTCGAAKPLDDYFPACIQFDPEFPDRVTGVRGEYRYVCEAGHWIDDPQVGEWRPDNPEAMLRKITSIHFHQMLSPTMSPREIYEAYINADNMKNFYNRKLGKPYQDPNQIPVTLEHLNKCAETGMAAGVVWKKRARATFMGIDQMGAFNVAIIKERLPDGRQAVIHVEAIYSSEPFVRCSELMEAYGVQICVVEQLPNFNDAMRFANRHKGRVFLCDGYGAMQDDYVRWGDAPKLNSSERRTDEDERTRYTVRVDQYKAMAVSLARLVNTTCLFADPQELLQEIRVKHARHLVPILKDVVFLHFQKTALVTERTNENERKLKRSVVKVGIDPHFSYANMLCDVAWTRAHGTAGFILPDVANDASHNRATAEKIAGAPGLPNHIVALMEATGRGDRCGKCTHYPMGAYGPPPSARCPILLVDTSASEVACDHFLSALAEGED